MRPCFLFGRLANDADDRELLGLDGRRGDGLLGTAGPQDLDSLGVRPILSSVPGQALLTFWTASISSRLGDPFCFTRLTGCPRRRSGGGIRSAGAPADEAGDVVIVTTSEVIGQEFAR